MKKLFEDDMLKVEVEPQKSLFYYEWKESTKFLDDEKMLEYSMKLLGFVLEGKYKLIVENAINLNFTLSVDIQEVIAFNIITKLNGVVEKIAHVYATDFIVNLSVELVWSENPSQAKQFIEKSFESLEDAINWLV